MIALTAYVGIDAATLGTMLIESLAELRRQKLAGGNFSMPGGRSRGGVPFADLAADIAALQYAISIQDGSVITQTVSDCSSPIP